MTLASQFEKAPIVPLVQADDPNTALKTVLALQAGGLNVIEVVLRTDAAIDCLEQIADAGTGAMVGAGTVLCVEQAQEAVERGAQFIVSPGLNESVVDYCQARELEIFPGINTPTEAQRAWNLGLRTVKFFPAGLAGGAPMLKALSSVFRDMTFMPTGGVSPSNLREYLSLPSVVACGGSWLTPQAEIDAGNFAAITALAKEAIAIAKG